MLAVLGYYYYFTDAFKSTRSSAKGALGETKFDFKSAKDISTRLDDVKGIDEIREEI